ncbi:MAG: STAS domain-containing protein [Mycobacterium sp.]
MNSPDDTATPYTAAPYNDVPSCLVTEHWDASTVVVSCAGVIDMITAPQLEQRLFEVLDKQPSALVVDLSGIEFLASHGMNVLVMVRRQLAGTAGFAVVADGPATSRPLRLIGLDDMINLCSTLEEAFVKLDDEGGAR